MSVAHVEAQLVWNRYRCMLIANSILLGFVGHLAAQSNRYWLGLISCLVGLVIALLWLFITSYGWSLSSRFFRAVMNTDIQGPDIFEEYQKWREEVWYKKSQDPLWWLAHSLIIIFCISYLLLALFFTSSISGCYLKYIIWFGSAVVLVVVLMVWRRLTKIKLCIWDE